jgi:hypothetical protein
LSLENERRMLIITGQIWAANRRSCVDRVAGRHGALCYAGRSARIGPVDRIFTRIAHPTTAGGR